MSEGAGGKHAGWASVRSGSSAHPSASAREPDRFRQMESTAPPNVAHCCSSRIVNQQQPRHSCCRVVASPRNVDSGRQQVGRQCPPATTRSRRRRRHSCWCWCCCCWPKLELGSPVDSSTAALIPYVINSFIIIRLISLTLSHPLSPLFHRLPIILIFLPLLSCPLVHGHDASVNVQLISPPPGAPTP